jgi:hypothetical protein
MEFSKKLLFTISEGRANAGITCPSRLACTLVDWRTSANTPRFKAAFHQEMVLENI